MHTYNTFSVTYVHFFHTMPGTLSDNINEFMFMAKSVTTPNMSQIDPWKYQMRRSEILGKTGRRIGRETVIYWESERRFYIKTTTRPCHFSLQILVWTHSTPAHCIHWPYMKLTKLSIYGKNSTQKYILVYHHLSMSDQWLMSQLYIHAQENQPPLYLIHAWCRWHEDGPVQCPYWISHYICLSHTFQ